MKTIEEYIELSKNMKSTSKGGSDSYLFLEDQVVLVKYTNLNKYGMAREMEEEVAVAANHKYEQGINTPAHIAWYRCKDEKSNYCYVLQQQAKGKCLVDYKAPYGDIKANIEGIKWINTIPEQHIEKAIRDLIQIFNMGLELKPKNLFYDEKYGYTFIDLLNSDETPAKTDNLLDLNNLFRYISVMLFQYNVSAYDKSVTPEQLDEFLNYKATIYNKIFNNLNKIIPNFNKYKRFILRTLEPNIIEKMQYNGYIKEDLSLTQEEINEFHLMIANIIRKNIQRLEQGNTSYGNILVNEIRIELEASGLIKSWPYHPESKKIKLDGLDEYDKERMLTNVLLNHLYTMFNNKVVELAKQTDNKYIQASYQSVLQKVKNQGEKKLTLSI